MYIKKDNTYSTMKKNAAIQWLKEEMESKNLVDRNGAKVTLEHIDDLNKRIKELEDANKLKEKFLKKLKDKLNVAIATDL